MIDFVIDRRNLHLFKKSIMQYDIHTLQDLRYNWVKRASDFNSNNPAYIDVTVM